MTRLRAALGSLAFLVVAPGVVAGLVPWLLTGWDVREGTPWQMRVLGAVLICAGVAALVHAFARFFLEGLVHWYEEPTLRLRYGAEYEAYRRAVPGWLPRRRPWRGEV